MASIKATSFAIIDTGERFVYTSEGINSNVPAVINYKIFRKRGY